GGGGDGRWEVRKFHCQGAHPPGVGAKEEEGPGKGPRNCEGKSAQRSGYRPGHEQEQHLQLAALRSAEHHRWLLRATSTGISAFVDATGLVVKRIPANVRDTALESVPMLGGVTIYEQLGDWPGWLCAAVLVVVSVRSLWRR